MPVALRQDVVRLAGPTDLHQSVGVVVQAARQYRQVSDVAGMALDEHPASVQGVAGPACLADEVTPRARGTCLRHERVDLTLQIPVITTFRTPHPCAPFRME